MVGGAGAHNQSPMGCSVVGCRASSGEIYNHFACNRGLVCTWRVKKWVCWCHLRNLFASTFRNDLMKVLTTPEMQIFKCWHTFFRDKIIGDIFYILLFVCKSKNTIKWWRVENCPLWPAISWPHKIGIFYTNQTKGTHCKKKTIFDLKFNCLTKPNFFRYFPTSHFNPKLNTF